MFAPPRTFQRTVYRPGEICQFDLWEPQGRDPGRARPDAPRLGRGRVPGLLARRRRRAGVLQADAGPAVGHRALSVVARRAAGDAGLGSPGRAARRRRAPDRASSPRFCGQLRVGWHFCEPGDPQAKGVVERLQGFMETNFEPGRRVRQRARLPAPARRLVRRRPTRARTRRCAAGPVDRLLEEREVMAPLPATSPDLDRRWVTAGAGRSLPALRHQRLLARSRAGRPARRGPRLPDARSPRSRSTRGELACRHARRSRATARSPRSSTPARCASCAARPTEPAVETRPLAAYDALIA